LDLECGCGARAHVMARETTFRGLSNLLPIRSAGHYESRVLPLGRLLDVLREAEESGAIDDLSIPDAHRAPAAVLGR